MCGISNESGDILYVKSFGNPIDNHHYKEYYFLHQNEIDTRSQAQQKEVR